MYLAHILPAIDLEQSVHSQKKCHRIAFIVVRGSKISGLFVSSTFTQRTILMKSNRIDEKRVVCVCVCVVGVSMISIDIII